MKTLAVLIIILIVTAYFMIATLVPVALFAHSFPGLAAFFFFAMCLLVPRVVSVLEYIEEKYYKKRRNDEISMEYDCVDESLLYDDRVHEAQDKEASHDHLREKQQGQ